MLSGSYKLKKSVNRSQKKVSDEQYSGAGSLLGSTHNKVEKGSNNGSFLAKSSGSYYSGKLNSR